MRKTLAVKEKNGSSTNGRRGIKDEVKFLRAKWNTVEFNGRCSNPISYYSRALLRFSHLCGAVAAYECFGRFVSVTTHGKMLMPFVLMMMIRANSSEHV